MGTKIEWKTGKKNITWDPPIGRVTSPEPSNLLKVFFFQLPIYRVQIFVCTPFKTAKRCVFRVAQVAPKGLGLGLFPKVLRWLVDLTLLGTIAYLSMPVATWRRSDLSLDTVLFEKNPRVRETLI